MTTKSNKDWSQIVCSICGKKFKRYRDQDGVSPYWTNTLLCKSCAKKTKKEKA